MELKLPYSGSCELTSRYGWRNLNGEDDYHNGIDLCGVDDKRILAPCAGVIGSSAIVTDHADLTWQWGNYVRIDCADGTQVFLCHMASRAVKVGQRVEIGDVIGVEGNTGYSFGRHCHLEVRKNGTAVDPTPYLGIPNEWGYYRNEPGTTEPLPNVPVGAVEKKLDNTPAEWAADAVEWAVRNGIIKGNQNGDYKLHSSVTRQDVLVFLYRAFAAQEEFYGKG